MTVDLAALAKLASEATPGPWIRPWASLEVHWMGGDDVLKSQVNLDLIVAAVNALPALVRVALAARAAANLIHMADWDPPTLHEAILRADSTLRAALADLDHD